MLYPSKEFIFPTPNNESGFETGVTVKCVYPATGIPGYVWRGVRFRCYMDTVFSAHSMKLLVAELSDAYCTDNLGWAVTQVVQLIAPKVGSCVPNFHLEY